MSDPRWQRLAQTLRGVHDPGGLSRLSLEYSALRSSSGGGAAGERHSVARSRMKLQAFAATRSMFGSWSW